MKYKLRQKLRERLLWLLEDERGSFEEIKKVVNDLTQNGKKPKELNFTDDEKKTPLHYAATYVSDERIIRLILLQCPELADKKEEEFGGTALHIAAIYKRIPIVNALLKFGVCPYENDKLKRKFSFYLKDKCEKKEVVSMYGKILGEKTEEDQKDVFRCLTYINSKSGLKYWNDKYYNNLFLFTVRQGEAEIAKMLYKVKKIKIYIYERALMNAITIGNIELVKFLFEKGAQTKTDKSWALIQAVASGHKNIVDFLISKGCKMEEDKAINCFFRDVDNSELNSALGFLEYGISLKGVEKARVRGCIEKVAHIPQAEPQTVELIINKIKERSGLEEDRSFTSLI